MSVIVWKTEYLLNIDEIDEQHKKLIKLVNEFYNTVIEHNYPPLAKLISDMLDYSEYHFATEERYMERFSYPDRDSHCREHEMFINRTRDFYERFKEGRFMSSLEITNFLREWISDHLSNTDNKLGIFLKSKSVTG